MSTEPTSETDLASQILVLVGHDPDAYAPPGGASQLFQHATRKQLLDCAQRLGLTGVSKLAKEELAGRIQLAFEGLRKPSAARTSPEARPGASPEAARAENGATPLNGGGSFPQKFDLGPTTEAEALPQNIPWGYGQDRVTAMVIDPDRLFVYWEVTDQALSTARAGLGRGGPGAWLNLRVYDITGRLFDGTNAHSYFDHRLERHDRQWFFAINKPTSAACVEVGLMSDEGYFAKVSRSGRVEFPRREPVGGGPVEWLSVRTATGAVGAPMMGGAAAPPAAGGAPPPGPGPGPGDGATNEGAPAGTPAGWEDWSPMAGFPVPGGQRLLGWRWQWQEAGGTEWTSELAKTEWVGPILRTEWDAGPFTYPVAAPSLVEYRDTGELSVRMEGGHVHVVYGPWQVVIRGLGARAERKVLSTWEYRRRVELTGGSERTGTPGVAFAPGGSEWLMMGASERAWLGASELVFRGASELWLLGASELLLRGASETMYAGASEYRYRGASERLLMGASERLLRGSSERLVGGASERMFAGASERALGGASELYAGASERLGGASERRGGADASAGGGEKMPVPPSDSPYPRPGEND